MYIAAAAVSCHTPCLKLASSPLCGSNGTTAVAQQVLCGPLLCVRCVRWRSICMSVMCAISVRHDTYARGMCYYYCCCCIAQSTVNNTWFPLNTTTTIFFENIQQSMFHVSSNISRNRVTCVSLFNLLHPRDFTSPTSPRGTLYTSM